MSLLNGLVIGIEKNLYRIFISEKLTLNAGLRGKLRTRAGDALDLPAVGDWVTITVTGDGIGAIEEIMPRRSLLARKAAGGTGAQALAANVDTVMIVSSLNQDLNFNRLDRYLTTAWDSGAVPQIVLSKRDLCDDWEAKLTEVEMHSPGTQVHAITAEHSPSWEILKESVKDGAVAVVVGSSGVGKSTLINCLLGREALRTGGIREDDGKGKHTTTARSMWRTPNGGWIIDTPGMRELQLLGNDEGLKRTFEDVEELFTHCRFRDCRHDREPGCNVHRAMDEGQLTYERWESYCKLQREIAFEERKARKKGGR